MPGAFSITVDDSQVRRMMAGYSPVEMQRRTAAAVREATLWTQRKVVGLTPFKTGALRASIGVQIGPNSGAVRTSLAYALPVEEGTRAHVIRPRHGKALAWLHGGRKQFARIVNHPGTKGRHMFRETAAESGPAVVGIFRKHFQ